MATERTYIIPLRREWLKSVKYKRAKKAVRAIKDFLQQHMKTDAANIKLGTHLNIELWKHGIRNPPSRIKVNVTKDDKGMVRAELFGIKVEAKKELPKAKMTDVKTATADAKKEEKPAEKKPAAPKAPAPAATKQPAAPKQQTGQTIR
jgi:ribosomal protein L31E